jgi:hypothetical protein
MKPHAILVALLVSPLCGCAGTDDLTVQTQLIPGSKYSSTGISFLVKNNTAAILPYTDALLFQFKRKDGDFFLASAEGNILPACNPVDYAGIPAVKNLAPGQAVKLSEAVELVAGRYCLIQGQTYNLRVVYASQVGHRQQIVYSSNSFPFTVAPH